MRTNQRNFSSRTGAHENAPKRSLFVNYSSNDLVGVTKFFGALAGPIRSAARTFCSFPMMICNQQVVGSNPTAGSSFKLLKAVLLSPEVFVYSYDPASFPTASILSGNFVLPFP
jgi:hypothetical protein